MILYQVDHFYQYRQIQILRMNRKNFIFPNECRTMTRKGV